MKEKLMLKDFYIKNNLNMDLLIDNYYGYALKVINSASCELLNNEDKEEILSDVFIALWKNSSSLNKDTILKPYICGICKNLIKNKYRKVTIESNLLEFENILIDNENIEELILEMDREKIIQTSLKTLNKDEYKIFTSFYYSHEKVKDIAKNLQFSESKVKVVLHRVRKLLKINLKNGGYKNGR